jgi:hypothetical protein
MSKLRATLRPPEQTDAEARERAVGMKAVTLHEPGKPRFRMVNQLRDKPQLPTAEQRAALTADPKIAAFLEGNL